MWKFCLPSQTEWRCTGNEPIGRPPNVTAPTASWVGFEAGVGDGDGVGDGGASVGAATDGDGLGAARLCDEVAALTQAAQKIDAAPIATNAGQAKVGTSDLQPIRVATAEGYLKVRADVQRPPTPDSRD